MTGKRCLIVIAVVCAFVAVASASEAPSDLPPPGIKAPTFLDRAIDHTVDVPGPQAGQRYSHPAAQTGSSQSGPGTLVRLADIPIKAVEDREGMPSRSHTQGQFFNTDQSKADRSWPAPAIVHGAKAPELSPAPQDVDEAKAAGALRQSFDGIVETGWIPPDTVLAAGPSHVIEATNSHFEVFSKLGNTTRSLTSFSTFFNSVKPANWDSNGAFMFDPKIVFEWVNDQFVMIVVGRDDFAQRAYLFYAISVNDDPNGSWYMWALSIDAVNAGDSTNWWDYASVGADEWGIYFTGNIFTYADSFQHSVIWSLTPEAFTGAAHTQWESWGHEWPTSGANAFAIQVAHPQTSAGGNETFLVNSWNGTGSDMLLFTLTGSRGSPAIARTEIDNATTWRSIGHNVDQPNNAVDIDGGDSRIQNAIYANRRVFATLTTDPAGAQTHSGAYLAKFNVDSGAVDWETTINSGAGYYYFYPAIALDGATNAGNIASFMSWTQPAATRYGSVAAKVYTNQPTDSGGPFVNYMSGLDDYVDYGSGSSNRWGDYTGASYDWTCDWFWGAAEYAGTSNTWRTRVIGLEADDVDGTCRFIEATYPNGGQTFTAGDNVTVTWDKYNLDPTHTVSIWVWDSVNAWTQLASGLSPTSSSYQVSMPNRDSSSVFIWVGTWDGAAWAQSDYGMNTFTINGLPDITVSSLFGATAAEAGETFSVSNTILNQGPVTASGTFPNKIFLSPTTNCSAFDPLIGSRNISNLGAGISSAASTSVTIPGGTTAGSYYICLWADAGLLPAITEFNELNNADAYSITISTGSIFTDGFETGSMNQWSSSVR